MKSARARKTDMQAQSKNQDFKLGHRPQLRSPSLVFNLELARKALAKPAVEGMGV